MNGVVEALLTPFYLTRVILQGKKSETFNRKNSKVIIVANGPSLKSDWSYVMDLRQRGYDCMAVNRLVVSDEFGDLKPNLYLVADDLFDLRPDKNGDSKLRAENRKQAIKVLELMATKCNWEMQFFVPFEFEAPRMVLDSEFINVVRFNKTRLIGYRPIVERAYKKGLGVPSSVNVLMPALINAINGGYREIVLFGVDFSWLKNLNVDFDGDLRLNDEHFYKTKCQNRNLSRENDHQSIKHQTFNFYNMMLSLDRIRHYANTRGTRIYNCSSSTMIESFERLDPQHIHSANE